MGGIPVPPTPQPLGLGGSQGARGMGLPFQQPVGGQIAEGLDAFVKNFMTARRGEQEYHKNKFYEYLSNINQGLLTPSSADYKKILKEAKLGGLPLKTEASPEEQDALYQQKVQDSAAAQASIRSPMAGGTGSGNPALNAVLTSGLQGPNPTPYAPTPATLARPGLLQRVFNPAGNVSLSSPAGQQLQRFTEASQTGAPMNPANVQQKGELGNLMQALQRMGMMDQQGQLQLSGQHRQVISAMLNPNDPKHNEAMATAYRAGIIPNLPTNMIEDLVRQSGGSPQQAAEMSMWKEFGLPMLSQRFEVAQKMMPRFTGYGDPAAASMQWYDDILRKGYSDIHPGRTAEETKAVFDNAGKLMDNSAAPSPLIMLRAEAEQNPGAFPPGYINSLDRAIGKYPTRLQFAQGPEFAQKKLYELGMLANDQGRTRVEEGRLALGILDSAKNSYGEEWKRTWEMEQAAEKSGNTPAAVAYLEQLRGIKNEGAQLTYPVVGADGKTFPYRITDPAGALGGAIDWYKNYHLPGAKTLTGPWGSQMPFIQGQAPIQLPNQQAPPTQAQPSSGGVDFSIGLPDIHPSFMNPAQPQVQQNPAPPPAWGAAQQMPVQWSPEMLGILNSMRVGQASPSIMNSQQQSNPDEQ